MKPSSLLGKGLYSLPEAARLLGVPTQKLRRWAEGYTFRLRDEERFSGPVIRRELSETPGRPPLTFADLIELRFVSMFRDKGVSMATIRAAAKAAAQRFGTDHPFAIRRFDTDGKRIFATLEHRTIKGVSDERLTEELAISQIVFDEMVRPFFLKLESEDDEISLFRPLGPGTRVVLDPRRAFGKPIDEKSGVPTFVLYQMVEGGNSLEDVAWWYGVEEETVCQAVEYERSLLPKAA